MTSLQIRAGSQHGWSSASKLAKRLIDLVSGLGSLIFLFPFLALIAVLIRLESKGPILIRESRIGHGGTEFTIRRFRVAMGGQASLLSLAADEPWLSRIGTFLTNSNLEFLPLVINLIRGEMSLIGPRALTLPEAKVISREDPAAFTLRNSVPPGLTGPWQLQRRLGNDLALMVGVDLDYVNRWSLILDLSLLMQAFSAFLWR